MKSPNDFDMGVILAGLLLMCGVPFMWAWAMMRDFSNLLWNRYKRIIPDLTVGFVLVVFLAILAYIAVQLALGV